MSTVSPAALPSPGSGRSVRLSRLSDELLARHAARGSERAFTVLYERYHQPLYRYCRSIVRHESDAQDALQSTFVGALDALRRDARNAPLRPWLYRIAHNEAVSLLRRRKRDAQTPEIAEPAGLGSSAEDEAAGRARWRRLIEDLGQLPERQRGALLLRELAGLSHEEIGLTLGLTVGAAKQAIFEARQGLAEVEEGRSMSCEEVRRRVSEGDRRVLRGRRVRAHLGDCAACEAFALAIPERQTELRAVTPALPPAVAAAVLGRVIGTASRHGGASATAGSAATAGAVGKTAGTVVAWKTLATVAVVATAAAGATGLTHAFRHHAIAHRPALTPAGTAPRSTAAGVAAAHRSAAAARAVAARSAHARAFARPASPAAIGRHPGTAHAEAIHGAGAAHSHHAAAGAGGHHYGSIGRSESRSQSATHGHHQAARAGGQPSHVQHQTHLAGSKSHSRAGLQSPAKSLTSAAGGVSGTTAHQVLKSASSKTKVSVPGG